MVNIELQPVEIPGNEQVAVISESETSIIACIQHNSIFGSDITSDCTAPIVLSIRKDQRGQVTASCTEHPLKKLIISVTPILLATKKLMTKAAELTEAPDFLLSINEDAVKGFSRHYGINEEAIRALALSESFKNNLLALFDYLEYGKRMRYPWRTV